MTINTNTNPYYDDFEEPKNYLQILFKPGYAVQARELTQLQTSLQKQIARFGSHVFKDGSIVLNGNTTTTPCNWIDVLTEDGAPTVGETFVGATSQAQGKVFAYKQLNTTTARLYFSYSSGASFEPNEVIQSLGSLQQLTIVDESEENEFDHTGTATAFSIEDSVFFINGYFAFCEKQTHILNDGGEPFNRRVGLSVEEKIVTFQDDSTLLDPAQGSYNFSAPGADRIAIGLTLTSFEYDPLVDELPAIDDFIELARFTKGILTFNQKTSVYNELEKNLARRTYDESGDYTVKAFSAKAVPHNGGDATKFSLAIGPGKAYVKGFEFETISTSYISVPRALDTKSITNHSVDVSYGDYFVIKTPQNSNLDYTNNVVIDIISNGIVIGTANVRHIEPVSVARYKLFLYNVQLDSNYATSDITAFSNTSSWYAEIDETYYTTQVTFERAPNRTSIIKLPSSYVKTLLDGTGQTNTEIESFYAFPAAVNTSGETSISSGAGKTFISTFREDYVVVNSTTGEVLIPSSVDLVGSTTANFTFSVISVPVTIYAPVVYSNLFQKNKVIQSVTFTADITTDKISLNYSDCYRLVTVSARNSEDTSGETFDVTAKFDFNNGQTDEFYDHGWIKLKTGQSISNTLDVIDVTFEYFSQNKNEGFFSVDSYPISYENIPTYVSVTGEKYRLSDCLDFRPRRESNGTAFIGQSIALPKSRISLDYSFYLPRIDKLILTKEKKFDVIKGVPSEQPRIPTDLYDAMTLYVLTLPAYTSDPSSIGLSYIDNKRYTMSDIGKIDKRVEKIEYYTALSLLEKQANDEILYNNLGVERFKNGILVDSFNGHSVGDVNSSDYSCSINKESRLLRPRFSSWSYGYEVSSRTANKRDDLIFLPFTEEILANQPYATNVVNVNPYQTFAWTGRVALNPATDNWVDTQVRPAVVVNLNGENDIYTTIVPNVNNPASTGVVWNDWQTVVRGVDVTQTLTNQELPQDASIDGITLNTATNAISSTIQTTTESSSYRTGISIATSGVSMVQRDLGTKVVDTSIVPYIRSRLVDFSATNMKPSTNLYALFDNVQVNNYCIPAIEVVLPVGTSVPASSTKLQTAGGAKAARILLATNNTVFVVLDAGSPNFVVGDSVQWVNTTPSAFVTVSSVIIRTTLRTNANGSTAGVFLIPNNEQIRFTTGEKSFRLTDVLGNRPGTEAEVKYVAQGLSQSLEKTLVSTRVATVSINPTQETSSVVTQSTTDQSLLPIDPLRIVCSEDENTGDFSNGQAKKSDYILSYEDVVNTSASGALASNNIVVESVTGIKVGMKVVGTGIATNAVVTSISGTTVTLSVANVGTVSGSLNVNFINIFNWIGIKYIPTDLPVKYTLYFNGNEYTTGYVGSSSYNSKLNSLGLPNVSGPGNGVLFIQRGDPAFTTARLVVDSPLEGSDWQFSVPCPLQNQPSTTLYAPTYSIVADKNYISEGETVTFNVKTTNVPTGTVLNWEIVSLSNSSSLNPSDFSDGIMRGSVTINNNRASFTKTAAEDLVTDGYDGFVVDLKEGTRSVAQSQSVIINDTSRTVPTYFVQSDKAVVEEGDRVTFNISTSGVPNDTVLYWAISGEVAAQDIIYGALTGTVKVTDNRASVVVMIKNDLITEGVENFILDLLTGSAQGPVVASSNNVSILDTSLTPGPTYEILPTVNVVNEGQTITFKVNTKNVANGTTLYWAATGISSSDVVGGALSGSVGINNNTGSIPLTIANDITTEGDELLVVDLKTGSVGGDTVATSPTVTVRDTSTSTPTYSVTVDNSIISEGQALNYKVTTTDLPSPTTLYWKISGTNVTTADFTDNALSGSVIITNNSGSISRILASDGTTEGIEYLTLDLKTGSSEGVIVATAPTVNVIDTSKTSTYAVSPNLTSFSEGQTITYTVKTSDVNDNTVLYWVATGTNISGSDFSDGQTSGSVVINNNTGTILRTLANDVATEGNELLSFEIKTGSTTGPTVATASTVTIVDTSVAPTYAIAPNVVTVNEGGSVTYSVTTTGVANGTTLYWKALGTNINGSDFTDGQISGSVTITGNAASFTRTLAADATTEGSEKLGMVLRTGSSEGPDVATASTITIVDTSPDPTYRVVPSTLSVNEGGSVTYTVTTTDVPNNTTLYWVASGTGITGADFVGGAVNGSFTITSNSGTITRTLLQDVSTNEGNELLSFEIKTGSTTGPTVATASTVTIVDTSNTNPTYAVTADKVSVNEGSSVTFTVNTSNVANNTVLYWKVESVSGTVNGSDFSGGSLTGSITISGNTASFTRTLAADASTEGDEKFYVSIRTVSAAGDVVATSETITIKDTSLTAPTYFVTSDKTTVAEGNPVNFTVTTTGVANGTTLYWKINAVSGTINSSDFDDNALSGSVVVNSQGTASITRDISADLATEATADKFTLSILDALPSGNELAVSNTITITDTSKTPTVTAAWTNASMSEGDTNTCTISTTGYANGSVLYWAIEPVGASTFTGADFTVNSLTGSVTINSNGTATVSKTVVNDLLTEGDETFQLKVLPSAGSATILATTGSVLIKDTSVAPTYFISSDKNVISEGETAVFTVTTTGVPDNTTLYWVAYGTNITTGDFDGGSLNGTVIINGSKGTITRKAAVDANIESESFKIDVRLGSTSGNTVATSGSVTIKDIAPTYTITADKTEVDEGGTVNAKIETTNIPNNTTLYWTASPLAFSLIGATAADFNSNVNSGSVVINNNTANVAVYIYADSLTEGNETFKINLRESSISGDIKASTQLITIKDTSQAPTYSVSPNVDKANEGDTVTWTVTTTNVPNGTILHWVASGVSASDFSDNSLSGTVTISGGKGTFSRTLKNDLTDEGTETITMVIKTGSSTGDTKATSPTVSVVDTSRTPPTYAIKPTTNSVNEGTNVTFNVTTTNIPNNTTLYWGTNDASNGTGINTISTSDFTDGKLSGTVTINNNAGSITRAISESDSDEEAAASFSLSLRETSSSSVVLATSSTVSITNIPKVRNASVTGVNDELTITTVSNPNLELFATNTPASCPISVSWSGTNFNANAKYYVSGVKIYLDGTIYTGTNITASFPTTQVTAGTKVNGSVNINTRTRFSWGGAWIRVEVTMSYASGDAVIDGGAYSALKKIVGDCVVTVWGEWEGDDPEFIQQNWRWASRPYSDPLAQTFRVDPGLYPNGVFVRSLDLFFQSKAATVPVTIELRPVVNGYPSSKTVIPFSTSTRLPGDVNVSTNGSVATNFVFNNLVYLSPDEDYAFVVMSDSDEYQLFTAVLGEFTITDSTKRVDKQAVLGSLFKSQNSSTWTAVQEEDLKFVLHKCVFTPNESAFASLTTKVDPNNGDVPYDVFFTTGENIDFAATNIDYEFNTGSGWKPYQLGSNVTMDSQQTLLSSDPNSLQFRTTLSTTDRNITPVIDLNRLSNVLVHNIINDDATGENEDFGGNAVSKYVTRKVKLAPGFDATDLKVYLFANIPSPSSVKVYYKVSVSTDPFFDDNQYVEMEIENSGTYSENSFVEYKYKTPFFIGEELEQETVAIASGDRFDTFAIKIVMLSPDSTKVPQIRDLRVIALDQ